MGRTLQAADRITTVKTEVAEVGIYVQTDNADDFNQAAAGYTYGILAQMDRENTDRAVEQLNEELGISIAVKEYDSLTALVGRPVQWRNQCGDPQLGISGCAGGNGRL